MKLKCFCTFLRDFFDENKLSQYIKTKNYEVFIAKIEREVHDLKPPKITKTTTTRAKIMRSWCIQ